MERIPTRDPPAEPAGRLDRSARTAREIRCSLPWPLEAAGWWPSCLEAYLPLNRRVRHPLSSENRRANTLRASVPRVPAGLIVRNLWPQPREGRLGRFRATFLECTCIHSRKSRAAG